MDTLRGNFGSAGYDADLDEYDLGDDETGHEPPPASIGTDERRMQVRAYNHWASLLGDRSFPSIEDLEPEALPDFGPYSVLLDFTCGIDDPAIPYLGTELAAECGAESGGLNQLSDVPSRSLLSRITDHYMQILANQAPIGFEAEFVNQRDATILYRGILLPYSSDGETIDFIYGVINWKELADQATADELLLEIDQALEDSEPQVGDRDIAPVAEWADGPASPADHLFDAADDADLDAWDESGFPAPQFGKDTLTQFEARALADSTHDDFNVDENDNDDADSAVVARLSSLIAPRKPTALDAEFELSMADSLPPEDDCAPDDRLGANPDPEAGLYDCLAHARELAQQARSSEDRTRHALYAAVGRAYDVSLAAQEEPEDFAELLAENELAMQDRAPMTPVVKLVFGSHYDKTRLTEYAAVLAHAQRLGIERGALGGFLAQAEGGLKGVVQAERRLRKVEVGETPPPADAIKPALADSLRALEGTPLSALDSEGEEFAVILVRRSGNGPVAILGEVSRDIALVEKVARTILG